MSSSTSNSRKIYSKISFSFLLVMATAMGVINLIAYLNDASAENIMGRVVDARKALSKIVAEDKDLVLFFGSSMVRAGFAPRQFDREMISAGKNVKSLNFGFGGLNPFFQDYLSRRIREVFQTNDRRLKLAIIEFNPFQASQTRWNRALPIVDSFITMLASDAELWEITKQDPERGIRLFNIKYIRNDISAEMITSYYGEGLFPDPPSKRLEEPENLVKQREALGKELNELFEKEYPNHKSANWHYGWQGGGTIPEERSARTLEVFKQYYATFQNDAAKQNYRNRRIRSADIEGLNFEPLLVESFIEIVKNFQQFSDKVEIVMLPRDTNWIKYSDETKARLAAAIRQIEQATGVASRNHQELDVIKPEMFRDTTHLAKYDGERTYTQFIVEQYRDSL